MTVSRTIIENLITVRHALNFLYDERQPLIDGVTDQPIFDDPDPKLALRGQFQLEAWLSNSGARFRPAFETFSNKLKNVLKGQIPIFDFKDTMSQIKYDEGRALASFLEDEPEITQLFKEEFSVPFSTILLGLQEFQAHLFMNKMPLPQVSKKKNNLPPVPVPVLEKKSNPPRSSTVEIIKGDWQLKASTDEYTKSVGFMPIEGRGFPDATRRLRHAFKDFLMECDDKFEPISKANAVMPPNVSVTITPTIENTVELKLHVNPKMADALKPLSETSVSFADEIFPVIFHKEESKLAAAATNPGRAQQSVTQIRATIANQANFLLSSNLPELKRHAEKIEVLVKTCLTTVMDEKNNITDYPKAQLLLMNELKADSSPLRKALDHPMTCMRGVIQGSVTTAFQRLELSLQRQVINFESIADYANRIAPRRF